MTLPLSPELPIEGKRNPECLSLLKGKLKNGEYKIGISLYFKNILYACPRSMSLYKMVLLDDMQINLNSHLYY